MNTFTVWYVLTVIAIGGNAPTGLTSSMAVYVDKPTCFEHAQRVVAADPNAKWACHEMTVKTDSVNVYVNFPNN
jgi:hypothetical protein